MNQQQANEFQMKQDFVNKYGNVSFLTDEEKGSFKAFGARVQKMSDNQLFQLYNGVADEISSEFKDIVSFEIKRREIELMKSKGIDINEENHVDNIKAPQYNKDYWGKDLYRLQALERHMMAGMTPQVLELSKRLNEENPRVVRRSDLKDGINAQAKSVIFEDDNGDQLRVDVQQFSEHFRKEYVKKLSEVSGIDFTPYDITPEEEQTIGPVADRINSHIPDAANFNDEDYEDD